MLLGRMLRCRFKSEMNDGYLDYSKRTCLLISDIC